MPLDLLQGAIDERVPNGSVLNRLLSMLEGFGRTPARSGLPQRSLASAVIANMYLSPLDDVLHHSHEVPELFLLGWSRARGPNSALCVEQAVGERHRAWVDRIVSRESDSDPQYANPRIPSGAARLHTKDQLNETARSSRASDVGLALAVDAARFRP